MPAAMAAVWPKFRAVHQAHVLWVCAAISSITFKLSSRLPSFHQDQLPLRIQGLQRGDHALYSKVKFSCSLNTVQRPRGSFYSPKIWMTDRLSQGKTGG